MRIDRHIYKLLAIVFEIMASVDLESIALVKSFLDWVNCLVQDDPTYIYSPRRNAVVLATFSGKKGYSTDRPKGSHNANGVAQLEHVGDVFSSDYSTVATSIDRKSILDKAEKQLRAHDKNSPHIANSIRKCELIAAKMTQRAKTSTVQSDDAEDAFVSDILRFKDSRKMNSNSVQANKSSDILLDDVAVLHPAPISRSNEIENTSLWSHKSIAMEALIRPQVISSNMRDLWDADRLIFDFNLFQFLEDSTDVGMVDTLFVTNTDDFDYDRLAAPRDESIYQMLTNSSFSVSNLSAPRYSIARIYSDFLYFDGKFVLKRELYSTRDIDASIASMLMKLKSDTSSSYQPAEVEGLLKAVTSKGETHYFIVAFSQN